jgi:hypothetical protein
VRKRGDPHLQESEQAKLDQLAHRIGGHARSSATRTGPIPPSARVRTGQELDDEMRRIQQLLGSRQPKELADYIMTPNSATPYLAGSSVPLLAQRIIQLANGVLVPASATLEPAPSDLMGSFLTVEELGLPFRFADAMRWLGAMPRDGVLRAVAALLGQRQAIDADQTALDRELAAAVFHEPMRSKALGLLRGRRVLLAPQALLIAAKAALEICSDIGDENDSLCVLAVLTIQSSLLSEGPDAEDRLTPGGRLFREIVRSQAFHDATYERIHLSTFQTRWREIPAKMPEPRVDLVAEFEAATGVPLDDFSALGLALWVRAIEAVGQPFPCSVLSNFNWSPERTERTLALIARPPVELGKLIETDELELGFGWSFDRLRQFPVVRLDGNLLVISPRLLIERVFGWLPIFDLREGFREAGDLARGDRALDFFRAVCERQALDSLRAIAGTGPTQRLYDEDELRAAFGDDRQVADAAFDAGSAWIVVEVSTRQLQRLVRGSDNPEALERDLEFGVYEKTAQLDSTVQAFREDGSKLTGVRTLPGRRCVPLLVATEGFPVNPMTTAAIEQEVLRRGLLRGPLVSPLRIVDQEELDMIESVVETGQASLLELLDGWGRARLRGMDMKSWLLTTRFTVRTPRRLNGPFNRAWRPALAALGEDPGELDNEV